MDQIHNIFLSKRSQSQEFDLNQCDCACPDRALAFQPVSGQLTSTLEQSKVARLPIDHKWVLLYNAVLPAPAVLDPVGLNVWEQFRQPRDLQAIQGEEAFHLAEELLAAGLLQPSGAQYHPLRSSPRRLSVWMHVTNRCNMSCVYCYVSRSAESMSQATGQAAVDAVLRSAILNGFEEVRLKYAGGEPTLNLPRVFALDDAARQECGRIGLGFSSVLLTNGAALKSPDIDALRKRGIRVMLSLDGLGEGQDAQRPLASGRGSFLRVKHTLGRLLEAGIQPFICITLTARNLPGLAQIVDDLLDLDLPFNLNFYRPPSSKNSPDDLQPDPQEIVTAIQQVYRIIENKLPSFSLLGMLLDRAQLDQPHEKACSACDSYLVIDPGGRIAKCHMQLDHPVTDIYHEDPLGAMRQDGTGLQNLPVDEKEGCRECEWRYWCGGGCPLYTYRTTGSYNAKSPYCNIYRALFPGLLRLEGLRLINTSL